jgi:hypothetical protein
LKTEIHCLSKNAGLTRSFAITGALQANPIENTQPLPLAAGLLDWNLEPPYLWLATWAAPKSRGGGFGDTQTLPGSFFVLLSELKRVFKCLK